MHRTSEKVSYVVVVRAGRDEMPLVSFNYVYYVALFVFTLALHWMHTLLIPETSSYPTAYFLIEGFGQSLLEIIAIAGIAAFFEQRGRSRLAHLVALFALLLLLCHAIDFFLTRLMDLSLWQAMLLIAGESWSNFLEMLRASHVSFTDWILAAITCVLLFGGGLLFYYGTGRLSTLKPALIRPRLFLNIFAGAFALLGLWDMQGKQGLTHEHYLKFEKSLPWKSALFSPQLPLYAQEMDVKPPRPSNHSAAPVTKKENLPNIFIFIAESLREDYITDQIAPNLTAFKQDNVAFPLALSNANATHPGWFSVFNARHPLHWETISRQPKKEGSLPLRLLKEMGYSLHVYTASRLDYYKMDELLLGDKHHLASTYAIFHEGDRACDCDAKTLGQLSTDIAQRQMLSGHVFIVFLESTHFDYSWPKEAPLRFFPIQDKINYLKAAFTYSDLEGIRNRYRNAIFHLDRLLGDFFIFLKKSGGWENANIVFCGDHGEEFGDQGSLFHASHLSLAQTHIPLYYKFAANEKRRPLRQMTTQVDIFPTLLHSLGFDEKELAIFDGVSLFSHIPKQAAFCARYNAGKRPNEFFLHNGRFILTLRLSYDRYVKPRLSIISIKDRFEKSVEMSKEHLEAEFGEALRELLSS